MIHFAALICGFIVDTFVGDPYWMPHPIRAIGRLISACEKLLRHIFPPSPAGERIAGMVLVLTVIVISGGLAVALVWLAYRIHTLLGFVVESILCAFMLAGKQLRIEGRKVRDALAACDLPAARGAVAMIVGRDTAQLDEAGVARATVETIAENTSDGVVAPLLFMAIGGAVAGVLYKAVNTMDSMLGYTNERYAYFGTAAAITDDILNWLPARISGILMCLVAPLCGLNGQDAWRIFKRDRRKHTSPNAAHTEAACAGALGVQLGGPSSYFGTVKEKPLIGDAKRPITYTDIDRANMLLFATSCAALLLSGMLIGCVYFIVGRI